MPSFAFRRVRRLLETLVSTFAPESLNKRQRFYRKGRKEREEKQAILCGLCVLRGGKLLVLVYPGAFRVRTNVRGPQTMTTTARVSRPATRGS